MGMPLHDLTGQKFGLLTVLVRADNKHGAVRWTCACDCGNKSVITANCLRRGVTRSCGCLNTRDGRKKRRQVDRTAIYQKRSSLTMRFPREHNSWLSMLRRCSDPADHKFHLYGGRGIVVCKRWADFSTFLSDMGPRPPRKNLDRENSDGNYEPANCRWATTSEQNDNRRCTRLVTDGAGKTTTLREFAQRHGLTTSNLWWHFESGHDLEKCVKAIKSKRGRNIPRGSCS